MGFMFIFYLKINMLNVTIFGQDVCKIGWTHFVKFLSILVYAMSILPDKMCIVGMPV